MVETRPRTSTVAGLPALGAGYSYRRSYAAQTYGARSHIGMLEVIADHFFGKPSARDGELELLAEHFALVPHGLDLSLGSADGLDRAYLRRFSEVVKRANAPWWSEHVAFTRAGGTRIGHLAPLPFTREALDVLSRNLEVARATIGRDVPCALENIAAPAVIPGEMDEPEFLARLVDRTGCGLLLDVENLHANAVNLGYDVRAYLDALPRDAVVQLHVAGGEYLPRPSGGIAYVDSHARAVHAEVWSLVREACARFPVRAIVLERDVRFPPFETLLAEIDQARKIGTEAGLWP